MTRAEKADPYLLVREPSRVKRVSKGSGQPEVGVQELVQKFLFMRQMMGGLQQNLGILGKIPGMKQMAAARNLKKAMAGGGFPGFPGGAMPNMDMFGGMGGMGGFPGFPGMPAMGAKADGESLTKMRTLSKSEKNAKKNQRKRERDARKKARK
jgi:signal recognition particle subunit SRP54